MTISQGDASTLIRSRIPFKCGNVYAEIKNGLYAVFSYGEHFPLAVYHPRKGWHVNITKWSPSTSIQTSKTGVRGLPDAAFLPCADMLQLVRDGSPAHQTQQLLNRVTARITQGLPQCEPSSAVTS
jgi:hypothetical protein